jgi:hypothetical protein
MLKFLVCALSLLPLVACGLAGGGATPVVIVVTATPAVQSTTSAPPVAGTTATPAATTDATTSGEPTTANLKPTDVQFVLAKQDLNIRNGPGTDKDIVGGVYTGQTAKVTGYQSEDGKWWRVECPVTTATECWVSADPDLTEPTTTANVGPTETPSTEVGVESFVRQLATAMEKKDYDTLKTLMGDPFTVDAWLGGGSQLSPAQAITLLQTTSIGANSNPVFDLADKTDQKKLLNGTDPLTLWDSQVKVVKSVYVTGLGDTNKDDALLIIAQKPDGTLYWYAALYAKNGFASYPH